MKSSYIINEKEKKRQYNRRILEVDRGSFTPLIFSTTGGMGRECSSFIHALATMLAEKCDQPFSNVINRDLTEATTLRRRRRLHIIFNVVVFNILRSYENPPQRTNKYGAHYVNKQIRKRKYAELQGSS